MSDCLYSDIDSYLEDAIEADMGASSTLYTTLLVNQIILAGGDSEEDWDPETWTLPAVVIRGVDVRHEAGPHGDGAIHLDITYEYVVAAVCSASSRAVARSNAQELGRRLREVLRSRYALGNLAAGDGETVHHTNIGSERVYVMPREINGQWFGIAALEFDVQTEI